MSRRWASQRPDPALADAQRKRFEREREENAERLARMRRVLVYAFPAPAPEAVVLVDVGRREIATFMGEDIARSVERLADYDVIAAVEVRALLRTLDFDPGERRLWDLGPPQKSKRLNRWGRTLKITLSMLVQGSCGISRPFGQEKVLREYLRDGKDTKFRRRLEADDKSLFALYQYGRLHGAVRLRWGFLDEMIPAPWVHRDEMTLYGLMRRAHELGGSLEVVVGHAPGWADPWSRARPAYVRSDESGWRRWLEDEEGYLIEEADVQSALLKGRDQA
ncbi:MAG: hypothetical protein HY337_04110 [Gemmatimonadetes bacterium]|nr:hypothetical protein [Gemmatimonadota bacterium]